MIWMLKVSSFVLTGIRTKAVAVKPSPLGADHIIAIFVGSFDNTLVVVVVKQDKDVRHDPVVEYLCRDLVPITIDQTSSWHFL